MERMNSSYELDLFRESAGLRFNRQKKRVLVCAGTGCIAGGSDKIYRRLVELCAARGLEVQISLQDHVEHEAIGIKRSGCNGFCELGPLLRIEPFGWLYTKVAVEDCEEIVERSVVGNEMIDRLLYEQNPAFAVQEEIPFYAKQTRIVLRNCGHIDAEDITEYIVTGGYKALQSAIGELSGEQICDIMTKANLRGRGGGGYPAGRKWSQVRRQRERQRYIVCNGDEGDPGAFMDRSIMEGNPHAVLEGMMIAGIAAGADTGYIYVRAEYPLAVARLERAIAQAEAMGLLGDNILGSDFCFRVYVNQGAGAFVCGEGSAMTASIEGNRGMPRVKPPRTVEAGLFGKPTVLNNVETFATVPLIIAKGADWFLSLGTENSPGTKAFALTGNVRNTGLIEVPMGTTLREIVFDIGGGIKGGHEFKAVQIGGPSGGCLTKEHLDLPLDFDSLKKVGAMIGSGGLVVMDEHTCMVEVARFFMNFTQNESCGKCVPCREGTKRMMEILERIVAGEGEMSDIDMLLELADTVSATALCGLGKTAAGPVVSTIEHFREEYLEHIQNKRCPTHVCSKLKKIYIDETLCKGCSRCARQCPVMAIGGKIKSPFKIDPAKCIKCGACETVCAFGAIKEM